MPETELVSSSICHGGGGGGGGDDDDDDESKDFILVILCSPHLVILYWNACMHTTVYIYLLTTTTTTIVLRLLWDQAPLACENFATLCANGSDGKPAPVGQSGKPLTYRQSTVHRVVPGFVVQGGDFVFVGIHHKTKNRCY